MFILTANQMKTADGYAIHTLGIPGATLMGRAAQGIAETIAEMTPNARRAVLVCGSGNNGGDGWRWRGYWPVAMSLSPWCFRLHAPCPKMRHTISIGCRSRCKRFGLRTTARHACAKLQELTSLWTRCTARASAAA